MTDNLSHQNFLALIVEDDPKLAAIFSAALQQANYKTQIIHDGQIAIQRLVVMIPDVVILDLYLPFVSGVEILKQIRANPRLAQTQVIVVTTDLCSVETLPDQADAVLIKPVGFIQLQNLVAKLQAAQVAKLTGQEQVE